MAAPGHEAVCKAFFGNSWPPCRSSIEVPVVVSDLESVAVSDDEDLCEEPVFEMEGKADEDLVFEMEGKADEDCGHADRVGARLRGLGGGFEAPKSLPPCPFAEGTPCCLKKQPCYTYYSNDDVQQFRLTTVCNGTLDRAQLVNSLRELRFAQRLPGPAKHMCVAYMCWWSGMTRAAMYPGRARRAGQGSSKNTDIADRSAKDIGIIVWFGELKVYLEQQPDTNEFHVGAPFRKDLYYWYNEDVKLWPSIYQPCSLTYFLQIWRTHCDEVKLKKVLRFTVCATCHKLRETKRDKAKSRTERSGASALLMEHYKFVKGERSYALMKANRSCAEPLRYLSMAMDGLPQFKYVRHKEEKSLDRLHQHLSLVMIHNMEIICYVTRDNVASDPNLSVECLQRSLRHAEEQLNGRLPPVLYLQLDNCWRENKNRTLLNWLGSLVERGLFSEGIEVGFLPVGHTHNEVDQIASRISIAVRNRDIRTPLQMMALLKESCEGMRVELLDNVADTKKFLNPRSSKTWAGSRWKNIAAVSKHQYYRIKTDALGAVEMHTKMSRDDRFAQPFYMLKGQGNEASHKTPFRPRPLQADAYGVGAVKTHDAPYRRRVEESLRLVMPRLTPAEWVRIEFTFTGIFDKEQVPFHWANGGVFRTEERLAELHAAAVTLRMTMKTTELSSYLLVGSFSIGNKSPSTKRTPNRLDWCWVTSWSCTTTLSNPSTRTCRRVCLASAWG